MLTLRLKRVGSKNRKAWRLIVVDQRSPRDSQLIEEIGFYNPLVDPPEIRIQTERYLDWIRKGAKPSKTVRTLIEKAKKPNRAN